LITINGNNYATYYPSLATNWTISNDGLHYRFYLRHGVKFASGNVFNAKAVNYTISRVIKLNLSPAYEFTQCLDLKNPIAVIDDYTIQLNLSTPFPPFLAVLANMAAGIMDPVEIEAHGGLTQKAVDFFSEHSAGAGSGPYVIDHWTRGVELLMKRNPTYWGGDDGKQPWFDEVLWKEVKEPSNQNQMLQRGDIDIAYNLTPDMIIQLKSNPNIELPQVRIDRYWFLGMSTKKPNSPFRDLKVRQAVKSALNRDEIVAVARGFGVPQATPFLSGYPGYDPSLLTGGPLSYNLTRAKALLAQTNWPNGFKTTILLSSASYGGVAFQDVALVIQNQLAKIGITLDLNRYDHAAYTQLFRIASFDGLVLGTFGVNYPDAQQVSDIHFRNDGNLNLRIRYNDTISTSLDQEQDLAARALLTPDGNVRGDLYRQAAKIDNEFGPWAYFYQMVGVYARSKLVSGGYPPYPGDRLSSFYGYELKSMWKTLSAPSSIPSASINPTIAVQMSVVWRVLHLPIELN
jgi:peptide/nickel transport system substrate-binding protein